MFGVFERTEKTAPVTGVWRWRNAVLGLAVALAGPGFLAYSLLDALYRDMGVTASMVSAIEERVREKARLVSDGRYLSPLAERRPELLPGFKDFPGAAAEALSKEPYNAYLELRQAALTLPRGPSAANPTGMQPLHSVAKQSVQISRRTVCVRLCDGYFFPIGRAANRAEFAEQDAQCRSRCGSPARLFVFPHGGSSPVDLRDLEGNRYRDLKTAFLHHVRLDDACSCRPQPWTAPSRERHAAYAADADRIAGRSFGLPPAVRLATASRHGGKVARVLAAPQIPSLEVAKVWPVAERALPLASADPASTTESALFVEAERAIATLKLPPALARKAERGEILASIDFEMPTAAKTSGNTLARRTEKGQRQPALRFVSDYDAPTPYVIVAQPSSGYTVVAGWSGSRLRAERSATDILRRNLLGRD